MARPGCAHETRSSGLTTWGEFKRAARLTREEPPRAERAEKARQARTRQPAGTARQPRRDRRDREEKPRREALRADRGQLPSRSAKAEAEAEKSTCQNVQAIIQPRPRQSGTCSKLLDWKQAPADRPRYAAPPVKRRARLRYAFCLGELDRCGARGQEAQMPRPWARRSRCQFVSPKAYSQDFARLR